MLVGLALVLLARVWWEPRVPAGLLVEVSGDVARPGLHRVNPPTLRAAVEAAGGLSRGIAETALAEGMKVWVDADGAYVGRARRPLLVGEPLNLEVDGVQALQEVPGLGAAAALAVVGSAQPPAREDLKRVMPARAVERLSAVARLPERRAQIDLNRADAEELERLPGIGPALAARIVADREQNGPFRSVDELDRVIGVGPATVRRVAEQATAGVPWP